MKEKYITYCRETRGNNKLTAIKSFYMWSVMKKLIKYNPFNEAIERPRITDSDKRRKSYFLTEEQINYIYEHMDRNNWDIRTKVMFSLIVDSGIRISALHSLKLSQLDLSSCMFHEVKKKMGYIIDVPFFDKTKNYLEEYINYRENKNINTDYLFYTKYNNKINHMKKRNYTRSYSQSWEIGRYS